MISLAVFEQGVPQRRWRFSEMVKGKDPKRSIDFDPNQSMFKDERCFWHEFHYFVSQVFYGERLGIKVAQKLKDGTENKDFKKVFDYMKDDEILHCDIFEDYIMGTFGSIFPASSGLEKVIRLCEDLDDPRKIALVTHGVLEPVSMSILKGLRTFVKDDYFLQFTDRVLRDEALHIRLVPDPSDVSSNEESKSEFHRVAITAFKAMASSGKCKLLLQKLEEEGVDISTEAPFQSKVYKKKFALSTKLVSNQLNKAGIVLFPK